jgi:hypothetical protein
MLEYVLCMIWNHLKYFVVVHFGENNYYLCIAVHMLAHNVVQFTITQRMMCPSLHYK